MTAARTLHDAVKSYMQHFGCSRVDGDCPDCYHEPFCREHGGDWDCVRDECGVISAAVRIIGMPDPGERSTS